MEIKKKNIRRLRRKRGVRSKIFGTKARPRLSVFKSNKNIFVQLMDDEAGKTLLGMSTKAIKVKGDMAKSEIAKMLGVEFAKRARKLRIKKVVFDRSGNKYHGRVKALAESARKEGLEF